MGIGDWLRGFKKDIPLQDFDIHPGPWFKYYLNDWMEAHDIDQMELVTSGIVTGEVSGKYIWVTDTPEWDREWFADWGYKFPQRWIRYKFMTMAVGESGQPALMPGL